jgi:Rnl2 family RNA ligase
MDFAIIYGEMFGGAYPHKDVQKEKVSTIQKGVYYCPNHEFYGFDIYVSEPSGKHYLSVEETNKFFESNGFLYAKTLFEGTLDECLNYPNKFPSQISQWLGYPPIEDNICEGVVIRPVVPTYIGYGDRVLIKNKNERFAEKKNYKKRLKEAKPDPVYSDALNALIAKGSLYVTENRLNNVVSHIGQVSMPKDLGKLIGMYSKDIIDDFIKESTADYNSLEKPEQKLLNKEINQLATALIKKVYKIPN